MTYRDRTLILPLVFQVFLSFRERPHFSEERFVNWKQLTHDLLGALMGRLNAANEGNHISTNSWELVFLLLSRWTKLSIMKRHLDWRGTSTDSLFDSWRFLLVEFEIAFWFKGMFTNYVDKIFGDADRVEPSPLRSQPTSTNNWREQNFKFSDPPPHIVYLVCLKLIIQCFRVKSWQCRLTKFTRAMNFQASTSLQPACPCPYWYHQQYREYYLSEVC